MEISEIKQRLTIQMALHHYGISADKHNRALCPFHPDKMPSLQLYPNTNTWTCFSSNCTAGSGDQIDFIMKKEGITKHEAILKAEKLLGLLSESKPKQKTIKQEIMLVLSAAEVKQQQTSVLLTEAFQHFARSMNAKPEKAIHYLASRKLDYKKLSIGYDAGTLHKMKETTAEQKQLYLQAGLLKPDKFGRENSYYTRFNGCIVFPLVDKSNNIASLYGRHCEKQEHHYLEGDHKGLYPHYPKTETTKLILTEAIIDAATLIQLKVESEKLKEFEVLALYGTNGFTDEHRKAIAELKELKEVILFFDGDEAGKAAGKSIAGKLKQINEKLIITVVETPAGEDVNSLSIGHETEIFTHLLENRKSFSFSTEGKLIENKKPETIETTGNTETNQRQFVPSVSSAFHLKTSNPDCLIYETDHLIITLWGGIEIHTVNRLRATLHIQLKTNQYNSFRDTADLYSHSQTDRLIKQVCEKLEISSPIVSEAIAGLTKELEQYRGQKREEKRKTEEVKEQQAKDYYSRGNINRKLMRRF